LATCYQQVKLVPPIQTVSDWNLLDELWFLAGVTEMEDIDGNNNDAGDDKDEETVGLSQQLLAIKESIHHTPCA
jgi:hypothetical protein